MKSQHTAWTRTGRTAREVVAVTGGPSKIKDDLTVPAGTEVVFNGHWVVRDLEWLAAGSAVLHEAECYGIAIDESDVTDIRDVARTPEVPRAASE